MSSASNRSRRPTSGSPTPVMGLNASTARARTGGLPLRPPPVGVSLRSGAGLVVFAPLRQLDSPVAPPAGDSGLHRMRRPAPTAPPARTFGRHRPARTRPADGRQDDVAR